MLERTPPEKYAKGFLTTFDPANGIVRFCNAGHNPPLLLNCDNEMVTLPSAGPPVRSPKITKWKTSSPRGSGR